MPTIELERMLVKSAPELWDELASEPGIRRWLPDVRVSAAEPPHRLEWDWDVAHGVIELASSGWGTKVRAVADTGAGDAALPGDGELEQRLGDLLDDLGSSSLTSG
jgi:hypothetical protein